MKYFDYLPEPDRHGLFFRQSEPFYKTTERETLRGAVGGFYISPA